MGNSSSKSTLQNESSNNYKYSSNREQTLKSNMPTEANSSEEDKKNFSNLQKIMKPKTINFRLSFEMNEYKWKIINRNKKPEDIDLILRSLSSHLLFSYISEESLETIIQGMKLYSLQANEVIFYQGNPSFKFFIIAKGSLEVIVNESVKSILYPGAGFGELALIHNLKRTETVKTKEKSLIWAIDGKVFREALKTLRLVKHSENKKFVRNHPLFMKLGENKINSLLSMMVSHSFSHGQKIVEEGEPGELFYIIQEGQVECSVKGQIIRTLTAGEYFGEQALIYNTLRTATVIAVKSVKVLIIGKDSLFEVIGGQFHYILYKNSLRIAIDSSDSLKYLKNSTKEDLISNFEFFSFSKGELAIPAGAIKNKYIWIVLQGKLKSDKGKVLERYQNLGAKWFYNETEGFVSQNYIALEDTDLAIIRKDIFSKIVPKSLSETIEENFIISTLKQVYLFRAISEKKLIQLAKSVKLLEFPENEKIFNQGDPGDSFYIIKEGEIIIKKNEKVIRTMCKRNFFGERSILFNELRSATVITKTKTLLWMITKDEFLSIIDENMMHMLLKRTHLQDDATDLSDLYILDHIGKGSYGSVFLCVKKQTRFFYALKTISRNLIESYDLHQRVIQEQEVLQRLEHQFIVKFVKSLEDSKRIYLLLEYVQGLSFFKVMRTVNVINSSKCRFYASCLLLILEHLHKNSIIYRDLKPENLMVDPDGYLKLIDFGTAKIIKSRTYTTIGTPHYTAPEVILGKGYKFSADVWSFGVIVYEMLCGYLPFGEDSESDPFEVYTQIITEKVKFPDFIQPVSRSFIQDLLERKISMRSDVQIFRSHQFFAGNDWEEYLSRRILPPYKPNCESYDRIIDVSIDQFQSIEDVLDRNQSQGCLSHLKDLNELISCDWDRDF